MVKFNAVAHEDIPENRIVVLTVSGKTEEDDRIRIRLAKQGETPDFVSTNDLEEGAEVTVSITNKTSWKVEAGEDIRSGVSVGIAEGGKLIEAVDGKVPQIGRSEEHTSELQSRGQLVCRLLLEKKKKKH